MLKPERDFEVPEETRKMAEAAFPKGNVIMRLRDELGPIFADDEFGVWGRKVGFQLFSCRRTAAMAGRTGCKLPPHFWRVSEFSPLSVPVIKVHRIAD